MLVPVRCFTCNMVLASKYRRYLEILAENADENIEETASGGEELKKENATQKAFRELEITRYCCRRHLLSHIDLVDKI